MMRCLLVGFVAFIMGGSAVATDPSAFDGEWKGERFDESGDWICSPTDIYGSIDNGAVRLTLEYNDTTLSGQIAADGTMELEGDHDRWEYAFTGKAAGDRIDGTWSVGNAPCRGTWFATRQK
jgi:hypothetical protein